MNNNILFKDEVTNMDELVDKLDESGKLDLLDRVKIAVICFIFDKDNKLILNRRGPGARDDVGKLQAIGGSVNDLDSNFRDAIARELREEAGEDATITINSFLGAQIDGKIDRNTGDFVNWIILGYRGTLEDGELINMEPERCVGFEKFDLNNINFDDVGIAATNFIKEMQSEVGS